MNYVNRLPTPVGVSGKEVSEYHAQNERGHAADSRRHDVTGTLKYAVRYKQQTQQPQYKHQEVQLHHASVKRFPAEVEHTHKLRGESIH